MAGDVESAGEPTSPQKSQISKTKLRLINMSDEKAACWRKKKNRSAKASKMKKVAKALERDRMIQSSGRDVNACLLVPMTSLGIVSSTSLGVLSSSHEEYDLMLLSQYGFFGALLLRRYNATKEAANSYLLEAERNAAACRSKETIKLLTVQYHGSVSLQRDFLLVCDIALQLVNDSEKSTPLFTTHIEAQKKDMVDRFAQLLVTLRGKDASLEAECHLYSDRCNTLLPFADELRKGCEKRPCHQIGLLVGSLKGLLTDIALQTTNCDHLLTEESTKWLLDMLLVQSGLTDLITTASEANVLYDEFLRLHNLLEERLNDSHNCSNSELQLDNELCDVMSSSMLDVHESIFNRLKIVAELLASHALVSSRLCGTE